MVSRATLIGIVVAALIVGVIGTVLVYRAVTPNNRSRIANNAGDSNYHGKMNERGMYGGYCPTCGQAWGDPEAAARQLPDNLPKPENEEWISRLEDILGRERLSRAQYEKDVEKYNLQMPYMMVIPQEVDHIDWIGSLFEAYGIDPNVDVPPVRSTTSATDALRIGKELESELIPDYEWLIKHSEDEDSRTVLSNILLQTRMHYTMFDHALNMGPMMRHGMGRRHMRR